MSFHTENTKKAIDEDVEDDEDVGPANEAPIETKFPLDVVKKEFSIFELHRNWKDGHLRLQPDFQRTFVWSDAKQNKLVESVLARIPLPVIYLSDDGESRDPRLPRDTSRRRASVPDPRSLRGALR